MRISMTNLKTRLRVAKEVLRDREEGQVMTCGKCGSTYIEKIEDNKSTIHYRAQYVCKNCGCYCFESQEWDTEKENVDRKWRQGMVDRELRQVTERLEYDNDGNIYRMSISKGSEFARYAKENFGYETSLKPSSDLDTFEKLFGPESEAERRE